MISNETNTLSSTATLVVSSIRVAKWLAVVRTCASSVPIEASSQSISALMRFSHCV